MAMFEWQDSDPPWGWWHGGGSSAESRRLKGHGKRPCGDPERHVYILCIMYIRTYDYNPKTRVLQNRGMVQLGSPQECFNHLRVFSVGHGLAASNMIISPWRNQCSNIWTSYAMLSGKKWTLPASYSPSKYLDRWEKNGHRKFLIVEWDMPMDQNRSYRIIPQMWLAGNSTISGCFNSAINLQ